jgi:hypothetical protein
MTHNIRSAAVAAAQRGFYVFPTDPNGKRPRFGLKWPEVATNDPQLVARCRFRPGENFGVAAKPSRLVIIDLDQPKPGYEFPTAWRDVAGINDGADVLAELAIRAGADTDWLNTFTVDTPSGGQHRYYIAPKGRDIGNRPLGPLIDIRGGGQGDGGYVLGPGSVLNGRPYKIANDSDPAPLPEWIADLLDPPQRATEARTAPARLERGDRVATRLDGLIATVLGAKPGERNNVLHWAACRAAEMVTAGQVAADEVHACLGEAARRTGLTDGEAHRTIQSALSQAPVRRSA